MEGESRYNKKKGVPSYLGQRCNRQSSFLASGSTWKGCTTEAEEGVVGVGGRRLWKCSPLAECESQVVGTLGWW